MDVGFGNYPIVLSDALLGKATKEIYTGIKYTHKDSDAPFSPSNTHRLQPNDEEPSTFNLSFSENSDKLNYCGKRTVDESQFILIFDAAKEHFVLHRLDSNFDMMADNSVNGYTESNLKTSSTARSKKPPKGSTKNPTATNEASRRKGSKPAKIKQPIREPTPEEEESDDGLTIEYPGERNHDRSQGGQSPIPSYTRNMRESVEPEDDILPDDDDASDHNFDSPGSPNSPQEPVAELSEEDIEMALEAELEQELLKESAEHAAVQSESDESEEE